MTDSHKHRNLGVIRAGFLNELQTQGKTIFSLDEAVEIYGKTRQQAVRFLRDLIKRV